MSNQRSPLVLVVIALAGLAGWGCGSENGPPPTAPTLDEPRAARGGNGNGGGPQSGDPVVRSVSPDSALQGETLVVAISGDNFEPGSTVEWALDGVSTAAIRTNAVSYVSSKELEANITVAADAETDLYDVAVTTPPGRRGVGSELLEVQARLVGFADPVQLLGGIEGDYAAPNQPVKFIENRHSFQVLDSPFSLTIDLEDELAMKASAGLCTDTVFTDDAGLDLDAGPRTLVGTLEISVNKRAIRRGDFDGSLYTHSSGIVVNFRTTIGGVEYFLTTGSSPGAVNAMTAQEDRFARTGGFLRVGVDGSVGPICQGIVDYEFRRIALP